MSERVSQGAHGRESARLRLPPLPPLAGLWLLVGFVSLIAGVLPYRIEGLAVPWSRVWSDVLGWLLWAALLPIAAWATHRFPMARDRWLKSLLAHAAVGLAVSVIYAVLATLKTQVVMGLWSGLWDFSFASLLPSYLFGGLPLYVVVYTVLAMAAYARESSRQLREREVRESLLEARLAEARLQVLKMQLDPHFLFNALNGVASQLRSDPRGAEKTIVRLSEFLRVTLRDAARQEVPLADELDFLRAYVAIEQARFGERLQVSYDIAADTLGARVPSLLLQPLVENSVRHGMRSQGLAVGVKAVVEGDELRVEVADDGRGLERGPSPEGVGLSNTRARLQQLYGGRGCFELETRSEGGVRALVRIPYREFEVGSKVEKEQTV